MQDVIAEVVGERLSDVSITKLLDGAIVFETECSYDRLNFFCFNNIFAVIDVLDVQAGAASPLERHIRKICSAGTGCRAVISANNKKIKSFRLVCSLENTPAPVNEGLRQEAEHYIAVNSGLKVDRSGPDTEFWFLYRREGFSVFMKRLTRSSEKSLYPGELTPQLAWLLCRLGGLGPGETAADPFCGYGAIPEAALKHFPIEKFYASDSDSRCIKITRTKPALKNKRCEIRRADVFSVPEFLPFGGIDVIITDPPWGLYKETDIPIEQFYEKTLVVFLRLLKPAGRAVILTAAKREFESAAAKTPELTITRTIPILVAGKKAAVYVMHHS